MNKVLVTGASGFVGMHLLEALSERGVQTTALYFSNKPDKDVAARSTPINWIKCNLINEDVEGYLSDIDVVFHLAGYSGLGSDLETIKQLNNINVSGTERIATAALRAGCRFIYVSSVHACEDAPGERVINEGNGHPKSEYGRSKRRAEDILLTLGERGLDFTILRPTQLFGEYHEGSVFELVRAIKQRRFFLIGKGGNATNFYYVKDFVDILLRVAENPICKYKTYIAADEPLQLGSLVKEISTHVGVRNTQFRLPRAVGMMIGSACDIIATVLNIKLPLSKQRVRAITRDVRYSNHKLATDIGGEVPYGIKIGLSRTIAWYHSADLL